MKFYVFLIALFGLVFAEEQVKPIPREEVTMYRLECLIQNPKDSKYFVSPLHLEYPDVPEVNSHMDCVAEKLGALDRKTNQINVDRVATFFSVDPNNAEDMDIIKNCADKIDEEEIHVRPGYLCLLNTRLRDNMKKYLVGE
ncbi:uncharacterized protein LOC129249327 [Anastrepha obliqua]|uniref:uncharacterized protein LOC129249327 n=1 Tax=Anastrepha obliqua TaxID=95512 RepID=UPI002409B5FF|nr:uncharacterized protein LOC129249327 [Anastrepha obliqua]